MGFSFVKFKGDDQVVTIARNAELPGADVAEGEAVEDEPTETETPEVEAVDEGQPDDVAGETTEATSEAPEE
jgi:DNA gyrase subunit A